MWQTISTTVTQYYNFYASYAEKRWNSMSPMEYGTLLILIGVMGWLMMKNSGRR
jgi:hypothetical protein